MKLEDRNKFYLEKMEEAYSCFCRSFCKITSYEEKVINSKNSTEDELELLQNFDEKFRSKVKHINKLLNENPLKNGI